MIAVLPDVMCDPYLMPTVCEVHTDHIAYSLSINLGVMYTHTHINKPFTSIATRQNEPAYFPLLFQKCDTFYALWSDFCFEVHFTWDFFNHRDSNMLVIQYSWGRVKEAASLCKLHNLYKNESLTAKYNNCYKNSLVTLLHNPFVCHPLLPIILCVGMAVLSHLIPSFHLSLILILCHLNLIFCNK